jgi:hypothetical protein
MTIGDHPPGGDKHPTALALDQAARVQGGNQQHLRAHPGQHLLRLIGLRDSAGQRQQQAAERLHRPASKGSR